MRIVPLRLLLFATVLAVAAASCSEHELAPSPDQAPTKLESPQLLHGRLLVEGRARPFGIRLVWRDFPGVIAINVYRATLPDTTTSLIATVGGSRVFFRDTDVEEGSSYLYRIGAVLQTPAGPMEARSQAVTVRISTAARVLGRLSSAYRERNLEDFADLIAEDFQFQHMVAPGEFSTWGRAKEIELHQRFFTPSGNPPGAESLHLEFSNVRFRHHRPDRRGRESWSIESDVSLAVRYARNVNPEVQYIGATKLIVAREQDNWRITTWFDHDLRPEQ